MRLAALVFLVCWISGRCDILDQIQPGEWFEVPNSKLQTVAPNPIPAGTDGVASVMLAWSGGAYDSHRDRLLVWGGGHTDYSGNEIYAFDLGNLKWSRLTNPSVDVGGDETSGVYPDQNPRSRHTYNYIEYVPPPVDRFCTFGGAGMYPSGQTGSAKTFCFDFDALKWESKSMALTSGTGTLATYDPATGKVWSQAGGNNGAFAEWDPARNIWTAHGTYDGWFSYYFTAAVGQGKFVAVGNGQVLQWDLNNPAAQPSVLPTTGDTEIIAKNCPGFVYDPVSGKFVAWSGGTQVYLLDLSRRVWSKATLAATNSVIPTAAQGNGTFGRFRYVPSRNLFIAVNAVNEDVYFFRLSAPTGIISARRKDRGVYPFRNAWYLDPRSGVLRIWKGGKKYYSLEGVGLK